MVEFVDYIERQRLVEELTELGRDLLDCKASDDAIIGLTIARRRVQKFPTAEVETGLYWNPVTTMPVENDGMSDNLILKTLCEGRSLIFVGFTQRGQWCTAMAHDFVVLCDDVQVTHWMYASELLGGVVGDG